MKIGIVDVGGGMRGSRDGFVETLLFNTAMIRRRIRDTSLTVRYLNVGTSTRTDLALVYMAADYALHRAPLRANDRPEAHGEILRRLLVLAVPITLSSSMVSVITLIDT